MTWSAWGFDPPPAEPGDPDFVAPDRFGGSVARERRRGWHAFVRPLGADGHPRLDAEALLLPCRKCGRKEGEH